MVSNMKLGPKLMLGFAVMLLFGLLQGAISAYQIDSVNRKAQTIADSSVPLMQLVGRIHFTTADIRIALLRHVMESDADKKKKLEDDLAKLDQTLAADLATCAEKMTSDEARQSLEVFKAEWKKVGYVRGQALDMSRSGDTEVAQAQLNKGAKAFASVADALQNLERVNLANVRGSADSIQLVYQRALTSTAISVAIMAVLGSVLALMISRGLARGIGSAASIVMRVAEGHLDNDIRATTSDELGQMLRVLQTMQSKLVTAVTAVRSGADMVSHASAEIAHGNLDLSNRTEDQARSLQEARASMNALESNVRDNVRSVQKANDLAAHAATIANKGGAEVLRVVATMKGIETASRKIGDILTVIDGIAFQTNILALNAAVEAARAGEEGRGFAVVASEVRMLAGRCSDAAKEIKALIQDSVVRVEEGGVLVNNAGTTMTDVVRSIQDVTDIMVRINEATNAQAQGISQVGQAVAQLDQVTQQNAALVEQMAAATGSLKGQAGELVEAVAVFRLSGAVPITASATDHLLLMAH